MSRHRSHSAMEAFREPFLQGALEQGVPQSTALAVFEKLFGDTGSTDPRERLARIQQDRSILDSVTDELASLQRSLPQNDRAKLNEYLDAVRDIERRIQKAEEQRDEELPLVAHPAGIPGNYDDHAKLMCDLMVLAYQCDLTRVATFMMGREFSGMTYPFIGVPDAHHPISHHQHEPEKVAKVAKINAYHVTLFAYLLDKLRSTPDGDGSLLDHMTLVYGAGMSDSNAHANTDLPIILDAEGRPCHPVRARAEDAAGEFAYVSARQVRCAGGSFRRQYGQAGRSPVIWHLAR